MHRWHRDPPARRVLRWAGLTAVAAAGGFALDRLLGRRHGGIGNTIPIVSPASPSSIGWRGPVVAVAAVAILAGAVGSWSWWNVSRHRTEFRNALVAGDPARAPDLMRRYGCAGCHTMSSVTGATGRVGPPLDDVAQRVYLAGHLPNTPETLVRWIVDPRALVPDTAMPRTGISTDEARDVAAYLLQQAPD